MNEWNIQSRGHACGACGRGFSDHEAFHTLLFDEKRDFRRLDVCDACWRAQYSDGSRDRKCFVSYWHGVYEAPAPVPEPIQKDTAESLLRKLIERNDPQYIPAGYILAVMLERKRLLRVKEQFVREGRRVFVYEHPRSGDIFTIVDPGLQLNQLDQVQHDVAALLEHGFDAPLPAPTGETSAAPAVPQAVEAGAESAPEPAPAPETTATETAIADLQTNST